MEVNSDIKKVKEFRQEENDIYFMEVLSDKIIINDNYEGILILDSNLNVIKRLKIFKGIAIYSSFVNKNGEILLFCPDNECMVYINIEDYQYKVISLKNGLEDLIFSTLYEWNENSLILTTYNDEFYNICVHEKTIQKIDYKEIERLYPNLYNFYQELMKYKVIKVFSDEYIAIIYDENCNINMINFRYKTKQVLNNVSDDFLDIEFIDETFAIVNENTIEIVKRYYKEIIDRNMEFIFLKARFVNKANNIFLVTLSSSQSDVNYSKIDMFQFHTL